MSALTGLFEEAQAVLHTLAGLLARAGVALAPAVELRRGAGVLTYFDREDGHVHLCLPFAEEAEGRLLGVYMGSVMGLGPEGVDRLTRFLLPWTIAHELGHCLRHRGGLFGDDPLREERAANDVASALTGAFYSDPRRAADVALVRGVAARIRREHPLGAADEAGLDRLLAATEAGSWPPEDDAAVVAFARSFAVSYCAEPLRYMGIQTSWMGAYLRSPGRRLASVRRAHLEPEPAGRRGGDPS